MDKVNIPIQVIVHCEAGGELNPLRFQYEDEKHLLHTVHIDQITDSRQTSFVGINAIHYICKAEEHGKEHMYELKYTINTHKWDMIRKIY